MKENIVEGSLLMAQIDFLFPLKYAMCNAHIRHDPLVSHVEITSQHMWKWKMKSSVVDNYVVVAIVNRDDASSRWSWSKLNVKHDNLQRLLSFIGGFNGKYNSCHKIS